MANINPTVLTHDLSVNGPFLFDATTKAAFFAQRMQGMTFGVVLVGATVTGTLKLQASNKNLVGPTMLGQAPPDADTSWIDIPGASATTTPTTAGSAWLSWCMPTQGPYAWVRLVWTKSGSAVGTATVYVYGYGPE